MPRIGSVGVSLSWGEFLRWRENVRLRSLAASRALRDGTPGRARRALGEWTFGGDEDLVDAVLRRLGERPPAVGATDAGMFLAPSFVLQSTNRPAAQRGRAWMHLEGLTGVPIDAGATDPVAWGLCAMSAVAAEIDAERARWRRLAFAVDGGLDRLAERWWTAWSSGSPWPADKRLRDELDRYRRDSLDPAVVATVRRLADVRGFSRERAKDLCDAVAESWFGWMLGPVGEPGAVPGWAEVAARVVEVGPDGPVASLAAVLERSSASAMASCAVGGGTRATTAAWVFPDTTRAAARAIQFRRMEVDTALDLHVMGRLLEHWHAGRTTLDLARRVVEQNRGRARARLRSLAAEDRIRHTSWAFGVDGLHARTVHAVGRYVRDRLWQDLGTDFALGDRTSVDPRCGLPDAGPDIPQRGLLTWIVLVVLKGRLRHLLAWAWTGGTGDQDTRWGELLRDGVPDAWTTAPAHADRRSYGALRLVLTDDLADLVPELRVRLELVANAAPTQPAFENATRSWWDPAVRLPKVRYREYVARAGEALEWLARVEALP